MSYQPVCGYQALNTRLTYDPVSSLDSHLPHGCSKQRHITPQFSKSHLHNFLICLL